MPKSHATTLRQCRRTRSANAVAPMLLRVKRGPNGDILTASASSDARYVNGEVTFTDGPYKGELAEFLLKGFNLIRRAMDARDLVEERIAGKPINPDLISRQLNRVGGNAVMTIDEVKDNVEF
jgi:hypothetical protein